MHAYLAIFSRLTNEGKNLSKQTADSLHKNKIKHHLLKNIFNFQLAYDFLLVSYSQIEQTTK